MDRVRVSVEVIYEAAVESPEDLRPRHQEVLELLAQGLNNAEIAQAMCNPGTDGQEPSHVDLRGAGIAVAARRQHAGPGSQLVLESPGMSVWTRETITEFALFLLAGLALGSGLGRRRGTRSRVRGQWHGRL